MTPAELIDFFKHRPLKFEPGTAFSYSNSNYVLLGEIIEAVSGQSYEAYLHHELLKPLGMLDSGYGRREAAHPQRADGYTLDRDRDYVEAVPVHLSVLYAAGGWEDPLNTDPLIGAHPEVYACTGDLLATRWGNGHAFETVDYPGAFDPNVSISDSWLKFSAVYCYDYVADNPYTESCASQSCCVGRVGDANNSGDDEPTIGDIGALISALFIAGTCDGVIQCMTEADLNQSGGPNPVCDDITISDIGVLISYLFINGPWDPDTNPSGTKLNDCL